MLGTCKPRYYHWIRHTGQCRYLKGLFLMTIWVTDLNSFPEREIHTTASLKVHVGQRFVVIEWCKFMSVFILRCCWSQSHRAPMSTIHASVWIDTHSFRCATISFILFFMLCPLRRTQHGRDKATRFQLVSIQFVYLQRFCRTVVCTLVSNYDDEISVFL